MDCPARWLYEVRVEDSLSVKQTQAQVYRKTATAKKVVGNVVRFAQSFGWREFAKNRRWVYAYLDTESINSLVDVRIIRLLFATVPLAPDVVPCSSCVNKDGTFRILLPRTRFELDIPEGTWRGTYRKDREYPPGQFDYVVTLQKVVEKESPVGRGL